MPAPANAAPPPAPPAPLVSSTAPVQSSVSVAKQDTSLAVMQEPVVSARQEIVARPDVAAKDKAARVEPEPVAARRETVTPRQSTNVAKQETTVVKQEAAPRRETAAPQQPQEPARVLDRDEVNDMIKRGQQYVANGDMSAARILLKRAAEAGDARAALALGATYDPIVLKELGAVGVSSDVAQARTWYERAIAQGSPEASKRLQQLAQVDR
jgi:TPR repeat protein